jgi:hypothetical protein
MSADEANRLIPKNLRDHVEAVPLVQASGKFHERLEIGSCSTRPTPANPIDKETSA